MYFLKILLFWKEGSEKDQKKQAERTEEKKNLNQTTRIFVLK